MNELKAWLWLSAALLFACQRNPAGGEQPSSSASAAASAAPAKPAAPKQAWYVGRWIGSYDSRRYEMKMPKAEGAVREWADDSGQQGTGPGTITLDIDEAGRATGTASGALGEMVVTGMIEGDALTLDLKATGGEPAKLFNGFVVAKRKDPDLSGSLQASSGSGLLVRDGTVVFSRKPGDTTP
jgi:hypothetical protein